MYKFILVYKLKSYKVFNTININFVLLSLNKGLLNNK